MITVSGHAEREIGPSGGRWSIVAEEDRPDPAAAFEDCAARAGAIVEAVQPVIGDGRLSTGPVTVRARRRDYDGPVIAHRAVARVEIVAGLNNAGAIAAAAGRELGRAASVTERLDENHVYARVAVMDSSGGDGPPVLPGPRTVSATVRVRFEFAS
jgi:uncharacterized protein YggE